MFDLNDVEPSRGTDPIPDGSYAKVIMHIRAGGADGQGPLDQGLLRRSNTPGSDVLMLDAEFTVLEGPYARRKFFQLLVVSGGKLDEKGASIGWNITKQQIRGMIDSALGLDPADMNEATKAKRQLRGLKDLDGISFIARIAIEPSTDPRYGDRNKLDYPVLPTDKIWRQVMDGQDVQASPKTKAVPKPVATAATPAWQQSAGGASTAAAAPVAKPATQGPAWLNG